MRLYGEIQYTRTGHRWQYNAAHALCMLYHSGYIPTQNI